MSPRAGKAVQQMRRRLTLGLGDAGLRERRIARIRRRLDCVPLFPCSCRLWRTGSDPSTMADYLNQDGRDRKKYSWLLSVESAGSVARGRF